MYAHRGADGYISPDALERRLLFNPDRWVKGFSTQVQAWGSRAHFMQVRVLFFMRHWLHRWTVTIRKVKYVQPPKGGYVIAPEASSDWADEQIAWISQTCELLMYLDIGEAPRYLRRMKNLVDSFLS